MTQRWQTVALGMPTTLFSAASGGGNVEEIFSVNLA
ncbi:hypothetical protein [Escherichia coli]